MAVQCQAIADTGCFAAVAAQEQVLVDVSCHTAIATQQLRNAASQQLRDCDRVMSQSVLPRQYSVESPLILAAAQHSAEAYRHAKMPRLLLRVAHFKTQWLNHWNFNPLRR